MRSGSGELDVEAGFGVERLGWDVRDGGLEVRRPAATYWAVSG